MAKEPRHKFKFVENEKSFLDKIRSIFKELWLQQIEHFLGVNLTLKVDELLLLAISKINSSISFIKEIFCPCHSFGCYFHGKIIKLDKK